MVIIGKNLEELISQHDIVSDNGNYDLFSISLTLSKEIATYGNSLEEIITYGEPLKKEIIQRTEINDEGIILNPGDCFLGCSNELIKMPKGYIGFIQTKGSLARLFILVHCCDSQVETGFEGSITFEIVNIGKKRVKLHEKAKVAQLYIFKASTKNSPLYNGKYNGQRLPTVYCF